MTRNPSHTTDYQTRRQAHIQAMSDEELRVKIAEYLGWTHIRQREFGRGLIGKHPTIQDHIGIDDYANDLNAMHKAEESLPPELNGDYNRNLDRLIAIFNSQPPYINSFSWHATARQKAEAFLLTVGLSADEPTPKAMVRKQ